MDPTGEQPARKKRRSRWESDDSSKALVVASGSNAALALVSKFPREVILPGGVKVQRRAFDVTLLLVARFMHVWS